MLRKNNAARLQETVRGVETMTRFALAVLAYIVQSGERVQRDTEGLV